MKVINIVFVIAECILYIAHHTDCVPRLRDMIIQEAMHVCVNLVPLFLFV